MPEPTGSYDKLQRLCDSISKLGKVVVCLSGGLDSSFLLWACSITLPTDKLAAFTFDTATYSSTEKSRAVAIANYLKVSHIILKTPEMDNLDFVKNDLLRCYYCKRERFAFLRRCLADDGTNHILEGSQVDDLSEYRPGMQAVRELAIISPLLEAGMSRADIELICQHKQLPFKDLKTESCLATRIKAGQPIEKALLERIDRAEVYIKNLGFELVRVRCDNDRASIEVEPMLVPGLMKLSQPIEQYLLKLGFISMQINHAGYRA